MSGKSHFAITNGGLYLTDGEEHTHVHRDGSATVTRSAAGSIEEIFVRHIEARSPVRGTAVSLWHRHKWEAVASQKVESRFGIATLTLLRCECGNVQPKTLPGWWTLEEVRGAEARAVPVSDLQSEWRSGDPLYAVWWEEGGEIRWSVSPSSLLPRPTRGLTEQIARALVDAYEQIRKEKKL